MAQPSPYVGDDAERARRLLGLSSAAADAIRREQDPRWRILARLFGPLLPSRDRRPPGGREGRRGGFTLVEVLIVVVLIAVLAAIVLPRFADSTGQAREETLKQALRTVRQSIELYRLRNADRRPGELGTETDLKADLAALLPAFPDNPVVGSAAVKVSSGGGPAAAQVGGPEGWVYDRTTGRFAANSLQAGGDGRPYCEL